MSLTYPCHQRTHYVFRYDPDDSITLVAFQVLPDATHMRLKWSVAGHSLTMSGRALIREAVRESFLNCARRTGVCHADLVH